MKARQMDYEEAKRDVVAFVLLDVNVDSQTWKAAKDRATRAEKIIAAHAKAGTKSLTSR